LTIESTYQCNLTMSFSRPTVIFGGSGFLGHALMARLAQQGRIIRVPTRNMDKARSLKISGYGGQIVPFLNAPCSDASVAHAVANADTVINLIGVLNESRGNFYQNIHVEIPARIARIAKQQGVKNFIHVSFLGANNRAKSKLARSKAAGEKAVLAFFPEATIFRPSIIFGPQDRLFNRLAARARFLPAFPVIGGGQTRFQPVYVGDVAQAIIMALQKPNKAQGKVFELGGPDILSVREILQTLFRETKHPRPLVNIPLELAKALAPILGLLPNPLLTADLLNLLAEDNIVCDTTALTFRDLGLTPTPVKQILPTYLYGPPDLEEQGTVD